MLRLAEDINLENYTLILPSVAVGNVGQLSIDLLITNLNLRKIGQFFHPSFVPIIGANAYCEDSNELITAIDIYAGIEKCIVAIQIRSPNINPLTAAFYNEVAQFVKERKIAKVIILSSSYDYETRDVQPQHLKLRYVASRHIYSESGKLFKELNWIPQEPQVVPLTMDEGRRLHIPGGGFAMNMFDYLCIVDIPCAILFKFCSEGDNITDAIALLYYLNQWIYLLETTSDNIFKNLKYPPSWKHLFGRPPSHDIY